MSTNLNTTLNERPYYVAQEHVPPPEWFSPILPVVPGSPSAPVYPGTLNSLERMEVERYLSALPGTDQAYALSRATTRAAITKIGEFATYNADPAIKAWVAACESARSVQYRQYMADAVINNKGSTSKTADAAGAGASAPPATQPVNPDV